MRAELINSSGARARARRSRPYGSGSSPGRAEAPFLLEFLHLNGCIARFALPCSNPAAADALICTCICTLHTAPLHVSLSWLAWRPGRVC